MNLDNILNNKLKKLSGNVVKKRIPKKLPKEIREFYTIKECLSIIRRGDLDLTYPYHRKLFNLACKKGYVDKDTQEIIQEV